jgi:esterase/lipase superfamily enzyme
MPGGITLNPGPRVGIALVLALAAFTLQACSSRPLGVLKPVAATVPDATQLDMLVVTTRERHESESILFSGERGSDLSLTNIVVSIPPAEARTVGEVQWPARLPANPAKEFATLKTEALEGRQASLWLKQAAKRKGRVLVFVHGYNNRFEDAVYRFAQIAHDSGADAVPVLFTWPSRGSVFAYNYDRESTNYSRDALEETLREISRDPSVKTVTVLAHSMGTWLAVEALRQMAIRDGRVSPKVADVILAAPDLDVDVFRRQWRGMGERRPRFTMFVSRDDIALGLSRRIAGNVDRLGAIDPSEEPYRSQFEAAGITIHDLTKLKTGDALHHGKFAESPEVVRLIGERLIAGQTITDSRVGLGERLGAVVSGAANVVGSAASVAISTPVAVVDANTRENYGEQVKQLGKSLGDTAGATAGALALPSSGTSPAELATSETTR